MLETLSPAERLAFVLHDMFAVSFDEIAAIVGRSPAAARQLASRARRRVRGAAPAAETDLARKREVVDAFLAASRAGDFEGLIAVLDPEVEFRVDIGPESERVASGAEAVAARVLSRGSRFAPFGPSRPKTSPADTSKSMLFTASISPGYTLRSCLTSITGSSLPVTSAVRRSSSL